jgi:hypothetical protein
MCPHRIAEEGAISPLVAMLTPMHEITEGFHKLSTVAQQKARGKAMGITNVAAGALATLAKDHIVNQLMITEDNGIERHSSENTKSAPAAPALTTLGCCPYRGPHRHPTARRHPQGQGEVV